MMENILFLSHPMARITKAVIHVGEGKGVDALDEVYDKLKDCNIQAITMDMANSYHSWVKQYFPQADIIYDHLHLIKMMNEKLDNVRKRVISTLFIAFITF